VSGFSPLAYYRLSETTPVPAADMAVNRGSLGTLATGAYVSGAFHPTEGALKGSANTAASFPDVGGNRVRVAYDPAFAVAGPLSVEFWANPAALASGDSPSMCPVGFTSSTIRPEAATVTGRLAVFTKRRYRLDVPSVWDWQHRLQRHRQRDGDGVHLVPRGGRL